MNFCLVNCNDKYELEKLVRIFMPFEKFNFYYERIDGDNTIVATVENKNTVTAELFLNSKKYKKAYAISEEIGIEKIVELKLCTALYDCFNEALNYSPEWGMLTGIRPAKLLSRLKKQMGDENAKNYLKEELKLSENKLSLCEETNKGEEKIISLSTAKSFSLYVSIPFCPSRCSYCSFVSHSVEQAKKLIPDYVNLLLKELEKTAEISKKLKLKLETIYIGGGTPTAITACQIEFIMKTIQNNFDTSCLREYTVEAGRPDTVTEEKLNVIKKYGATRISINPQTMNDSVLSAIGRKHTAKQTEEAFLLARKLGFDNINMDLIAGLPTDTVESFKSTIEKVLSLDPESVTVHSLSMKRSSTLTKKGEFPEIEVGKNASIMVDYSRKTLTNKAIFPYYMYRQSKTVGNLENVGYSKKGYECLYNVFIMDETHSIFACGASAVTKLREPKGNNIERIFNYKYPYEYINNFEEIIKRKDGIYRFYEKYSGIY